MIIAYKITVLCISHPTHLDMQLHTLFVVQSKKTEELEQLSRGYGLLLSASGLKTEEMRDEYSTEIKKKVNLMCYTLNPEYFDENKIVVAKVMLHATFSPVRCMEKY